MSSEGPIRNVSDTALWAAMYRAVETGRPDALFRDPFAHRLAGERGEKIFHSLPPRHRNEWAWSMRTWLFDRFLSEEISNGADMVINLAAGLDARPYHMNVPPDLQWIEVDLPDLFAYKESILGDARPLCRLERVPLDLAGVDARRALFAQLGSRSRRAVVLSEGLLVYLSPDSVGTLARDLAAQPSFRRWILDLLSPGLRKMLQKQIGAQVEAARAPFLFAPAEGPPFFEDHGWDVLAVESTLQNAARLRRVGLLFRLIAKLPESRTKQGSRPWSATVMLGNRGPTPEARGV